MENKRTEELRKYKASIKSKLMAAVAMLLVSTILLGSTTYAWFILSTAPEVTGMTTTVGSNGSLEIALLNNETAQDTTTISAGVGDSSAARAVTLANESWGNIVDISTGYGMDKVTLYPSALNMAEGSTTSLVNLYSPLSVPVYGADGRVAELSADDVVSGKYNAENSGFAGATADYGVRAVGTADEVNPVARALTEAQSYYNVALNNAKSTARNALNGTDGVNATALAKLLIAPALEDNEDYSIVVTVEEKTALGTMIDGLSTTADYIEAALKLYVVGYQAANANEVLEAADVNLADYSYMSTHANELSELRTDITTAQNAYTAARESDNYESVLDALVDQDKTYINDKLVDEYTSDDAGDLIDEPQIYVKGGLLSDVANFVDSFASDAFDVAIDGAPTGISDAVITASPAEGVDAYLPYLKTDATAGLDNMTVTSTDGEEETGVVMITNEYGYIIDLAFRASTGTDLMLSKAANRVDEDALTEGGGSTFTLTSGEAEVLDALRIVFIDANSATFDIIGVAAPVATATEGAYELHMFGWSIEDGALVVGDQKDTDKIVTLTADEVQKISVLVYLDGNYIGTSLDTTQGNLNLQFSSSQVLTPMDYSDWVTTIDSGSGDDSGDENP